MQPVVSAASWNRNGRGRLAILRQYLAANLERLLREREVNQRAFAEGLGITEHYLSRIMNQRYFPSEAVLEKMAKALGVSAADLVSAPNARAAAPSDAILGFIRDLARERGYDLVKKKT